MVLPVFSPERLLEARKQAGLTQEEVAQRAQLTRATVQNVERGRRDPQGYVLARLAQACGVSIDSLFVRETDNLRPTDADPRPPVAESVG